MNTMKDVLILLVVFVFLTYVGWATWYFSGISCIRCGKRARVETKPVDESKHPGPTGTSDILFNETIICPKCGVVDSYVRGLSL